MGLTWCVSESVGLCMLNGTVSLYCRSEKAHGVGLGWEKWWRLELRQNTGKMMKPWIKREQRVIWQSELTGWWLTCYEGAEGRPGWPQAWEVHQRPRGAGGGLRKEVSDLLVDVLTLRCPKSPRWSWKTYLDCRKKSELKEICLTFSGSSSISRNCILFNRSIKSKVNVVNFTYILLPTHILTTNDPPPDQNKKKKILKLCYSA